MSRAALLELLGTDAVLTAAPFEIDASRVFSSFGLQGSRIQPNPDGYFIVIRWEETLDIKPVEVQVATIWLHRSRQAGPDYVAMQNGLHRIRDILSAAIHVSGDDGKVLTQASYRGTGPDLVDEGYDTFTKYAVFQINTKVEG